MWVPVGSLPTNVLAAKEGLMSPIRVLHLETGMVFRGGQNQVRLLLEGFNPKRVESHLVIRNPSCKASFNWPHTWLLPAGGPLVHMLFLVRLCQQLRIQLIHAHMSQAHSLLLGMRVLGCRIPAIVHRRVIFPPKKGWIHRTKYSSWVAQGYIGLSRAVRDQLMLHGVPESHIHIIPSCVEPLLSPIQKTEVKAALCHRLGIPVESPLIGFCSHLTEEKGCEVLLNAFGRLNIAEAHLVIAGAGPLEDKLKAQFPSKHIHFIGHVDEVSAFLAACDLFVFPSLSEGLGSTLLQAGQVEAAVIASDVGGIPDIILPEKTGVLVPPGEPVALSHAITQLLGDPTLRTAYGHALAQHVATHFSQQHLIESTTQVYETLLRAR
jgi:glycosyltransferase involved in cell wall biosynthesis